MVIIFILLLVSYLIAVSLVIFIISKFRRLLFWGYSDEYDEYDIDFYSKKLLDNVEIKNMKMYSYITSITAITGLIILISCATYWFVEKKINEPNIIKINLCKDILTQLYCTHPSELDEVWNNINKHINEDIKYKLNPNNLENSVIRHQKLNSKDTTINFKDYSGNGEIILMYTISSESYSETRLAIFKLNEFSKIVEFNEYTEPEKLVKYFVGGD